MTDHPQSVALAARQPRQNNRCADKIGDTPHPPAGLGSQKFFSFIFFTDSFARAHGCWLPARVRQLKRLRIISVFFIFSDLLGST
ncbi:hypothetical protein ACQV2E_16595 [Pantoea allii]|uniref:hypothetical protein n=1 Tax=Pantoea allii TaxID=574096 RepID=UPI00156026F6|nr:hypothetical protein [Pantoea allii]NQS87114.1 hypothetical protein [Pantoea allii]